jgi:hypothetical protein
VPIIDVAVFVLECGEVVDRFVAVRHNWCMARRRHAKTAAHLEAQDLPGAVVRIWLVLDHVKVTVRYDDRGRTTEGR